MERQISATKAYEESEDIGRNPSENATLGDVIGARFSRRDLLKGALAAIVINVEDEARTEEQVRGAVYDEVFEATCAVIGDFDSLRVEVIAAEPTTPLP